MMKRLTFILLGCLILTGCSNSLTKAPELPKLPKFTMPDLPKMPKLSLPSWAKPKMPSIDVYKPQLGMSKQSVMNLIGSPSIIDPFHQYQWDYINHSTIDGEIEIRYRLRLIFSGNLLSEIDKSGLEELLNSN
jgi:outer membrane protein assembly factor BamE